MGVSAQVVNKDVSNDIFSIKRTGCTPDTLTRRIWLCPISLGTSGAELSHLLGVLMFFRATKYISKLGDGCDPFNPFQSVCNLHQDVCIACHEEHFAAFNLTSVDREHRSEYFHTSYWNTVENRFHFSYFRTSRCKIFNSFRFRSFQNTISTLIQ